MVLDEKPGINLELDSVATYYSPFLGKLCSARIYSWNPIFAQDTPTQVHSPIVSDPFTFTYSFCKRIRIDL